jgi:RNA polymerase sigma-70 factor (ECF subfamily)
VCPALGQGRQFFSESDVVRSRFFHEVGLDDDDEENAVSDARSASAPVEPSADARLGAAPDDDDDILEQLRRGDRRAALSLCVQRHGASIGRLCLAMLGSETDADDLTQETLLTAHEAFGDFRGDGSVRGWLHGIARNKCLQHIEKHRRRGARLRLVTEAEATRSPPDAELGAKRRDDEARALLARVKPSDRDALILRYCCELSFKDVAVACGIEEAAARKRVSRALLELRRAIGSESRDE